MQIVKDLNLPRFKLEQFQVSCDWPAGRGSPLIGPDDVLQHDHQHGGVQLPEGGAGVQAGVLLLPPHHLRALLHARHRVLGQLLAGPQRCARPGVPGGDHSADHVHTTGQRLSMTRSIVKSMLKSKVLFMNHTECFSVLLLEGA